MTTIEQRRRHVHDIRVTVAVLAVSAFIVLFTALYVQLATGNDPAIGNGSTTTASSTSTSAAQADSTAASDATWEPRPMTSGQS